MLGECSSATDSQGCGGVKPQLHHPEAGGPGRSYLEPLSPFHKTEQCPVFHRLRNQLCIAGPVIIVWLPVTHGPVWGWPPCPCAPLVVRSQESKSGSSPGSEVRTSEPGDRWSWSSSNGPSTREAGLPLHRRRHRTASQSVQTAARLPAGRRPAAQGPVDATRENTRERRTKGGGSSETRSVPPLPPTPEVYKGSPRRRGPRPWMLPLPSHPPSSSPRPPPPSPNPLPPSPPPPLQALPGSGPKQLRRPFLPATATQGPRG